MSTRERIWMTAGIVILILLFSAIIKTVHDNIARRWMFTNAFHDTMLQDVESGSIPQEGQ